MSAGFAVLFLPEERPDGNVQAAERDEQVKAHTAAEQHRVVQRRCRKYGAEQQQERAFTRADRTRKRQRGNGYMQHCLERENHPE